LQQRKAWPREKGSDREELMMLRTERWKINTLFTTAYKNMTDDRRDGGGR
jgi:hypothetical protein